MNAAGLSYTSIALMDALQSFEGPVIEVHMSNRLRKFALKAASFLGFVRASLGIPHGQG